MDSLEESDAEEAEDAEESEIEAEDSAADTANEETES